MRRAFDLTLPPEMTDIWFSSSKLHGRDHCTSSFLWASIGEDSHLCTPSTFIVSFLETGYCSDAVYSVKLLYFHGFMELLGSLGSSGDGIVRITLLT